MAEFIGTMLLILFGSGVNCQVVLSSVSSVASSQKGVSLNHNHIHPNIVLNHIPTFGHNSHTCLLASDGLLASI